jgi:hypothetical protein
MIMIPLPWLEWLSQHGLWTRPDFLSIDVPEAPDAGELRSNIVLREVRDGYPKWVHLMCPRCQEHIQLPVAGNPHWSIRTDWLRRPTIHPSIWQTAAAKRTSSSNVDKFCGVDSAAISPHCVTVRD